MGRTLIHSNAYLLRLPIKLPETAAERRDAQRISERVRAIIEAKKRLQGAGLGQRERLERQVEAHEAVVDYYLWALQRMFERREDRFFNMLRSDYRLIMDLDDKSSKEYGEWYSDENPLTLEKIKPPAS